jgi:hypothetical protein
MKAVAKQRAEAVKAFLEAKGEMVEAAHDHTKTAVGIQSTHPPPPSLDLDLETLDA